MTEHRNQLRKEIQTKSPKYPNKTMEICLRCHKAPSRNTYMEGSFENDMRTILVRLEMMETLMSKFTNIFSSIQVITPQTEPPHIEVVQKDPKPNPVTDFTAEIIETLSQDSVLPIEITQDLITTIPEDSIPMEFIDSTSQDSAAVYNEIEENAIVAEEYIQQELAKEDSDEQAAKKSVEFCEPDEVFPLKTLKSLNAVERALRTNPLYKAKLKIDLKHLKEGMGTESSFTNVIERIIDRKLLHYFNWYGLKGKRCMQGYTLFNELLKSIHEEMYEGGTKDFMKDVNVAIAISHRRINNQFYRIRKKGHEGEDDL